MPVSFPVSVINHSGKSNLRGTEDMAQQVRALVALTWSPSLIPITHMVANTICNSFQGIGCPLLTSIGNRFTHMVYTHNMQAKYLYI